VVLGYRSVVTISEESTGVILELNDGLVNYRASRRANPDPEPQAIRSPNATARTIGGLLVSVNRDEALAIVTTVCALEGAGSATVPAGATVDFAEGHCVKVTGSTLGTPCPVLLAPVPVPIR